MMNDMVIIERIVLTETNKFNVYDLKTYKVEEPEPADIIRCPNSRIHSTIQFSNFNGNKICQWTGRYHELKNHLKQCLAQDNLYFCCPNSGNCVHSPRKKVIGCDKCKRICPFSLDPPILSEIDLKEHLKTCQYNLVVCNECGVMDIPSLFLETHKDKACTARMLECDYCNIKFVASEVHNHIAICAAKVTCLSGCGVQFFIRDEKEHYDLYCLESVAFCSVNYAFNCRCLYVAKRKFHESHMIDAQKEHDLLKNKWDNELSKAEEEVNLSLESISKGFSLFSNDD